MQVNKGLTDKEKIDYNNRIKLEEITIPLKDIDLELIYFKSKELVEFGRGLMKSQLLIEDIQTKNFEIYNWFEYFKYDSLNQEFKVKFSNSMKSYLYGYLDKYSIYSIQYILNFRSQYTIKIYPLLSKNRNLYPIKNSSFKSFEIDITELHEILQVPESFKTKYSNFKRKVLDYRINEINKKSDLYVKYEEIKRGNKIVKIKFYFKTNHFNKRKENNEKLSDYFKDIKHNILNKTELDYETNEVNQDYVPMDDNTIDMNMSKIIEMEFNFEKIKLGRKELLFHNFYFNDKTKTYFIEVEDTNSKKFLLTKINTKTNNTISLYYFIEENLI